MTRGRYRAEPAAERPGVLDVLGALAMLCVIAGSMAGIAVIMAAEAGLL